MMQTALCRPRRHRHHTDRELKRPAARYGASWDDAGMELGYLVVVPLGAVTTPDRAYGHKG
jgi:hypothetical protein